VRDGILGDLEETYRERRAGRGAFRAGAWYAVEALALAVRFLPHRFADASAGSLGLSWLDLKLGFRLLGKHPGLSLAGGSALAVTIAFGAGLYEFFGEFIDIELPFPEGERIVRVTNWDAENGSGEPRSTADFVIWREAARSFEPLAASATFEANAVGPDGVPIPMSGVRATASLFDALRTPPALGRPLLPSDEVEGSPWVVVVSHDVWQTLLGAAPLDGLSLRVGGVDHGVVGVMPDGFRFPIDHRFWVPLRIRAAESEPRAGTAIVVFGRLAPGATRESAQSELSALGRRARERWPDTHTRLEPRVTSFWSQPGGDWQRWVAAGSQSVFGLLLALAALNVAILSFSRTASRQGEIAVRTALGAGRRRIVTQLCAEALALSGAASLVGLGVAWLVVPRASELFWRDQGVEVPYWVEPGLSGGTIVYSLLLAALAATIAGMVPALKVTGKGVADGLRSVGSGGSRLRFGALPTVVIVVQVAAAVAFLPHPTSNALATVRYGIGTASLAADRILSAQLQPDAEEPTGRSEQEGEARRRRFAERLDELQVLLAADPEVVAVTFGDRLPGQPHRRAEVRLDGPDASDRGLEVRSASVVPGYFEALGARVLAGRAFGPADAGASSGLAVTVVNAAFARSAAVGGNVLGRRVGFVGRDGVVAGPWLEVVGIVENLDVDPGGSGIEGVRGPGPVPAVYVPSTLAELGRVEIAMQLAAPAAPFGPRLRRAAASIDPAMRVDEVRSLEQLAREARGSENMMRALAVLLALLIAGLAVGGVYTLMSFLVEQRTREIGIRTALGAAPATILRDVFSRALLQLSSGVLVGLGVLAVFLRGAEASFVAISAASAGLVLVAGIVACALPSRRALGIEPIEALRSE
jgi:predicted permease